ncbi:MAG: pyruvate, phosphate dikinase, partial [Ilumatobacter sp.]|nr:pyruvate, phosphate dikinase [Ilumatobacter sp.]
MKDWRTGADSLRLAVTAALAGGDTAAERAKAVLSITAADLDDVIHAQFEAAAVALTSGLGASPGAGVGKVYFSADDAADAADRGEDVVLVRNETTPADVHGMMVANG